jgi:hypothetical protein
MFNSREQQTFKMSQSGSDDETGSKKKDKLWKLEGGVMVCRYVGYKKWGDRERIIELEFTFNNDLTNPRIVGMYSKMHMHSPSAHA